MRINAAEIERIGGRAKNPDIDAALRILELNGLILNDDPMICGCCGQPWADGMSCGQKDNGWPFQTCYPAIDTQQQAQTPEATGEGEGK